MVHRVCGLLRVRGVGSEALAIGEPTQSRVGTGDESMLKRENRNEKNDKPLSSINISDKTTTQFS